MTRAFALFWLVVGFILLYGGGRLLLLGGSPYYFGSGIILMAVAIMLWRRRRLAAWLYAAYFVITLGWALWESGADGWALVPRLAVPTVFGLLFFLPAIRRHLKGPVPFVDGAAGGMSATGRFVLLPVACIIALLVGWSAHTLREQQLDPIYRRGTAPPPITVAKTDESASDVRNGAGADWLHYGGDSLGSRFSRLEQLNPRNVGKLNVAWTYRLGDAQPTDAGSLEVTPLKVGDTVYLCSASNVIVALDAESGTERWRFDPKVDRRGLSGTATCRGVAYYHSVDAGSGACAGKIITSTTDARLIAVDARSGEPCADFGQNGEVSLLQGMGEVIKGYYYASSAPTLVRGKIVIGGWVSDGQYWGEPSGVIRAFDATSGALAWAFDMGRPDRTAAPGPGERYTPATPNSWGPMSADEELGLVFAPTGNATPDYFGGRRRPFDDKYSSSVVAIDAETGRVHWSFQTTHHDLWDYDVASQPSLLDLKSEGGVKKVLLQPTKRGELFLLDRETGQPLAEVTEHSVPQGGIVPGERLSPTQPFSDGMPSVRGPELTEAMMWGVTPLDQLWCRLEFRKSRYEGPTTPPGLDRPNIVYPGYVGGSNWGGVSFDPDRGMIIVNSLRMANRVKLLSREETDRLGVFPLTVESGKKGVGGVQPQKNTPYGAWTQPFLSPLGVPCQQPPYGMLSGIDLASRKVVWTKPFGTAHDAGPFGIPSMLPLTMGVPNIGGALTTRGGLTFIGASQDRYIRAFETATGKLLWEDRLPAGGQATPMSYLSKQSGRQFVVIAAGDRRRC